MNNTVRLSGNKYSIISKLVLVVLDNIIIILQELGAVLDSVANSAPQVNQLI